MGSNLTSQIIDQCENDLHRFIADYENFYGKENMIYNLHLLNHICDSVRNFGPLWNFSLYCYENVNGALKRYIKGPKQPIIQVIHKRLIFHNIHHGKFARNCRKSVIDFSNEMINPCFRKFKGLTQLNKCFLLII